MAYLKSAMLLAALGLAQAGDPNITDVIRHLLCDAAQDKDSMKVLIDAGCTELSTQVPAIPLRTCELAGEQALNTLTTELCTAPEGALKLPMYPHALRMARLLRVGVAANGCSYFDDEDLETKTVGNVCNFITGKIPLVPAADCERLGKQLWSSAAQECQATQDQVCSDFLNNATAKKDTEDKVCGTVEVLLPELRGTCEPLFESLWGQVASKCPGSEGLLQAQQTLPAPMTLACEALKELEPRIAAAGCQYLTKEFNMTQREPMCEQFALMAIDKLKAAECGGNFTAVMV